ncbi:hypothetical protein [Clostridium thermopalmarium]|uniref:Uncharacterized protein n=1 Tax=Clostridium thermopalmarium DSM 5974 TaxID=1121340 RepID=A0A2T0AZ79_9CLOT|nr:hypothetical protein [Clostridium thermopalmarium]PRR76519.1 hypothetical protein CPAL_01900 [Clostridium thermopalmarium DSM 5974]PVZ28368.1 hypothetical protein LX19_00340 [Clostridium thermopalmarium DSM 5974]
MKKKFIYTLLTALTITSVASIKAFAAVDAYVLKDNTNTYQYNLNELSDSLINNTLGQQDKLYKEFEAQLSSGKIYLLHDSEGKYVSYDEVKNILIEKTLKEEIFDLNSEVKKAKEADKPSLMENIKKENGEIVRELMVLKEGTSLDGSKLSKDRYKRIVVKASSVNVSNLQIDGDIVLDPGTMGKVKLENVKCNAITILSGDKKGIQFNKVENKKLNIDGKLDIEIQYESDAPGNSSGGGSSNGGSSSNGDSTQTKEEAERIALLTKAKTQLTKVYGALNNEKEKEIVSKMLSSLTEAINDKNYDPSKDEKELRQLYGKLSSKEKDELKEKILNNVTLSVIFILADMYNIGL